MMNDKDLIDALGYAAYYNNQFDEMVSAKTIRDVFDTLNEKQKKVVYATIGMALSEKSNDMEKCETISANKSNMDFITPGGYVYSNYIKPEDLKDPKTNKPEKKTKRGFDNMSYNDARRFTVDKIYLNGSYTCVVWRDGTKTVVNCAEGDYYDEYAAFTAALAKKIYGNNTALKRMLEKKTVVQKPLPGNDWRKPVAVKFDPESLSSVIRATCDRLNKALLGFESVEKKDND